MSNASVNLSLAHEGAGGRVWGARPFSLVSLLDMLYFYAEPFHNATNELRSLQDKTRQEIERRGKESKLTPTELEDLRNTLRYIESQCERVELKKAVERLGRLASQFMDFHSNLIPDNKLTLEGLEWELKEVQRAVISDLRDSKFIYVPQSKHEFCDSPALFGELVDKIFPQAHDDITETGNCYAVGSHTACVFHLMRVVEHGLRALAKNLKIKLPKKRHIDLEEWGGLIDAIEKKIGEIQLRRRTHKREADLQFYHGAAAQFRRFKNAWRNHVMHTNASYDKHDANRVMEHVREFMQHLATKLKE